MSKSVNKNYQKLSTRKKQFIKFLMVGFLNTLIGYFLFVLFTMISFDVAYALAFTYVFGAISNFFTTGKLVFGIVERKFFFRFLLVYLTIYITNLALLSALIEMGAEKLISQALLLPFMAIISFFAFKSFVFKEA